MSKITALVAREPVRTYILGVILASLAVLKVFGVDLTGEQVIAVTGLAVAVLGVGELVRSKVTPV